MNLTINQLSVETTILITLFQYRGSGSSQIERTAKCQADLGRIGPQGQSIDLMNYSCRGVSITLFRYVSTNEDLPIVQVYSVIW